MATRPLEAHRVQWPEWPPPVSRIYCRDYRSGAYESPKETPKLLLNFSWVTPQKRGARRRRRYSPQRLAFAGEVPHGTVTPAAAKHPCHPCAISAVGPSETVPWAARPVCHCTYPGMARLAPDHNEAVWPVLLAGSSCVIPYSFCIYSSSSRSGCHRLYEPHLALRASMRHSAGPVTSFPDGQGVPSIR